MLSVDAFVCFHPASLCELYEPFNRSLIVIASTRYELGRHSAERWTAWNANVVRYANDERRTGDFVGANNRYDAEYMRYFTGIAVVPHLPSFCGYAADGGAYAPSRPSFILAPMHNVRFAELFAKEFEIAWCRRRRPTTDLCAGAGAGELLFPLRRRYPRYNYSDLAAHRGIVHVPYQVSVMSLFEQYRMNIPLFFPSIDLLTKWQLQYLVRANMSSFIFHPLGSCRRRRLVMNFVASCVAVLGKKRMSLETISSWRAFNTTTHRCSYVEITVCSEKLF